MRISKSKFVAGVKCLKRLYLHFHQPELAGELDETSRTVIEQGHEVGLVAQRAFPGGVTVDADYTPSALAGNELRQPGNLGRHGSRVSVDSIHQGNYSTK
jgi:hypothetical protein